MTAAVTTPTATVASGWVDAGLYVLAIGVLSLIYALANAWGCHVAVFILYSLLVSAAALLAITGFGGNAGAIMRTPHTWVVGLSNIAMETAYVLLLSYLPPAEGSLLIRLSIPVSMLIGLLWLGRRPSWLSWLGAAVVSAAILLRMPTVDQAVLVPVLGYCGVCALAVNVRGFASEFHPWNRAAKTVTDKMRVTGIVTLVTASATAALIGSLMALVASGAMPGSPFIPRPGQLVHQPTILLALFAGGAVFTAMVYLSFSAVMKICTENFIAASAFMPPAAFLVQWLAAAAGLIALPPFDWRLLPAMAAAIAGVLLIIWGGRR
jgi:drug/metabolite transporter (DMT)-like permease